MRHYTIEKTGNKTQCYLIMENVTIANGHITDIKQPVSPSEYQAYLKVSALITWLKEVKD